MIKFVYFDVGGVLMLDFTASKKWEELQTTLGVSPKQTRLFQAIWDRHQDEVCTSYDVDDMVQELRTELQLSLPEDFSLLGEFVNRFERNPSIYPTLEIISRSVPVGLLTDMYPRMLASIQKKNLLPSQLMWSVILDSSEEKYQKPDERLFRLAEDKAQAYGNEVLFVDNRKDIMEAASRFGWKTFWYDSAHYQKASRDLLHYFNHIGLG